MAKKELGQTPAPTVASAMSEGEGQEEDELKSLDQESDGKTSRTPSSGKMNRIIYMYILRPPFLRFTKFKFRFVDLPFSVFFCFLSKTVQTDQNLPFFWIRRLKFENLGNFCNVLETLRQVKTNKMAARQTFPHTGEPKRAFKLQKYDPKRQIKQHFEGKVGKKDRLCLAIYWKHDWIG